MWFAARGERRARPTHPPSPCTLRRDRAFAPAPVSLPVLPIPWRCMHLPKRAPTRQALHAADRGWAMGRTRGATPDVPTLPASRLTSVTVPKRRTRPARRHSRETYSAHHRADLPVPRAQHSANPASPRACYAHREHTRVPGTRTGGGTPCCKGVRASADRRPVGAAARRLGASNRSTAAR